MSGFSNDYGVSDERFSGGTPDDELVWNLWVWDGGSWRVLASYPSRREARAAARHTADPPDTWIVTRAGDPADLHMRENCTRRMANVF